MPLYNDLRPLDDFASVDYELVFPELHNDKVQKKRTIKKLIQLRAVLKNTVRVQKTNKNLLVASWNLKEFGSGTQRRPEAYFYIAEIISKFDLVAIQEVKSNMGALTKVMRILGDRWRYVVNDVTGGKDGNTERSAYVFNQDRVKFSGLAGEIVLWDKLTENSSLKQLKRTPYITGFTAGWKTFAMINFHLDPGSKSTDFSIRRQEVELFLAALDNKLSNGHLWNENLILVGDFNFYEGPTKDDQAIQMILDAGFRKIASHQGLDTNASETEEYDRMFVTDNGYFQLGDPLGTIKNGGVFNPFDTVYKFGEELTYKKFMKADYGGTSKNLDDLDDLKSYFKQPWRKNQLSDHLPIWIELIVDSTDEFLQSKLDEYG
jgi:endonuclease/exonuclease/phosphatase family metal-dependent hydrolase